MFDTKMKDIVLAVTYRCNSRCRMCGIWQIKDHGNEITAADLARLPAGLKNLNFTGGEPFLRPDLIELVAAAKKACPQVKIAISSNGFATDLIIERTKEILKIDKNIVIAISLDGVGEAHEKVRNIPGAYEKVLATVRGLQAAGARHLRLAFTIGDYNYEELPKVYALASELGVEMTLAAVHSSDNFFHQDNPLDAKEEIIKQLSWLSGQELASWNPKRWIRAYFAYGLAEFVRTGRRVLPDYSGEGNCFIDPQGNVYACDIATEKIGRLQDGFESLSKNSSACAQSWMICTAREAIRRHWFKVFIWVMKNKMLKKITAKLWQIKKNNDYNVRWYSIFINPYFLIRRGLYQKIAEYSATVKGRSILDVGCGSRPYEGLFSGNQYLGIDVEASGHKAEDKKPDKYFDGENIPYEDESFDTVICTEVLEHAGNPDKLVSEIKRVLKSGGELYLTVPFVWNEHETPYDFRRFTSFGVEKLLSGKLAVKSLRPTIGVFGVVGALLSAFLIEKLKIKNNFISYALIALFVCFPVQLFFLVLDFIFKSYWITTNWVAVARK